MWKKMIVLALLGAMVLVGAVAYLYLKTPAEASAPIQAIPIEQETSAGTTGSAAESGAAAALTSPPGEPGTAATSTTASATSTSIAEPTSTTAGEEAGEPDEPAPTSATAERIIFEIEPGESQARYVIDEVLRGTPTTVTGVTDQVAGQIAIDPADPRSAQVGTILINARTFATDESRRDNAVRNRILLTDQYEYITFTPTALEGLPTSASVGEAYTFRIVGELTIRDVTREVTFDVTVTPLSESRLEGSATTTIRYADWGISIPQVPFVAGVSDEVQLELDFVAAAI